MGDAIAILSSQTGRLPSELLAYYAQAGPGKLMVDLRLMARGKEISSSGKADASTAEGAYDAMRTKMGDYEELKRKQIQGYV